MITVDRHGEAHRGATATVTVPYVSLPLQMQRVKPELMAAVESVVESGAYILGPRVADFEQRFAEYCGTRFAVGVSDGTSALVLSLRALGIGPGDEVITAPNSFIASAAAIAMVGATPRFVDVGDDLNLDPNLVAKAITGRTKALLPVHLTGRPADMDPLLEIARARGLAVIEDAAQAVMAEYRGRRVGGLGTTGCFSLHPLKTLNACGDGGVVTTNDADLARKIRRLRDNGLRARGDYAEWAVNSRLDTIQAAILLVKLKQLEGWTARRRANAALYQAGLAGVPGLVVPSDRPHERAVYHTFVIQSDRREGLKEHLASVGVGTSIHYPTPIHLTDAAKETGYGP